MARKTTKKRTRPVRGSLRYLEEEWLRKLRATSKRDLSVELARLSYTSARQVRRTARLEEDLGDLYERVEAAEAGAQQANTSVEIILLRMGVLGTAPLSPCAKPN